MKTKLLLIAAILLATVFAVFAQESEPMANPECTIDGLADAPAQIDELYAAAQAALEAGDVRGWLDNLQTAAVLTNALRAFCDGYTFEGDAEGQGSQVVGPVVFQPGIYTVTVTTNGPIIVRAEEISGECRLSVALNEDDATEGAQEIFTVEDEPCTVLLEMSLLREPWRVEFTLIAAGD